MSGFELLVENVLMSILEPVVLDQGVMVDFDARYPYLST